MSKRPTHHAHHAPDSARCLHPDEPCPHYEVLQGGATRTIECLCECDDCREEREQGQRAAEATERETIRDYEYAQGVL